MNYLIIEELRNKLNCLIEDDSKKLCSGEILRTSQELDKYIVNFHKNISKENKSLNTDIKKKF